MNKKRLITIVSVFVVFAVIFLLSLSELKNDLPENPIQIHAEELKPDKDPVIPEENNAISRQGNGKDENKEGDEKSEEKKDDEENNEEGENPAQEEENPKDADPKTNEDGKKDDSGAGGKKESDNASDQEGDGKTAEESAKPGPQATDPLIITDLKNQFLTTSQLKNDTFRFYAYLKNNDADTTLQVKIRNGNTSLKGEILTGKGKNFSTKLSKANEGYNFITLYMRKNGKAFFTITYTIRYTEDKATPDKPEQGEFPPVIKTNLDDRTKPVKSRNFIFTVSAKTHKGKYLSYDHLHVTLDGKTIKTVPTGSETYEYDLYFKTPDEGDGPQEHVVSVLAWDDEGNSRYIERKVIYEYSNDGDVIGTVTVNVDATTIGLGVIGPGTTCKIKQGEPASAAVVEALKAYGLTAIHEGTATSGFYLKGISGGYIANGAHIPDNLQEKLEADGLTLNGTKNKNQIMEFDYTEGSGWVYTINGGVIPGRNISGYYLEDGDVLTLRFTLAYGKDLGGTSTRGLLSSYCGRWMDGVYTPNHNMGKPEVVKKATCEEAGVKESHCQVQGCTECVKEPIPPTGHKFRETGRQDATYDADGWINYICDNCSTTRTEVIPRKEKPEDPTVPEDPTQPEVPTEPENPTEPEEPIDPEEGG